jgi:uncharacterized sulfatase
VQPELFETYLADGESGVRYWAATGLLRQGKAGVEVAAGGLREALRDAAPNVRVVAAEALARYGEESDLKPAVEVLLAAADASKGSNYLATAALNALTEIGAAKVKPYRERIAALPKSNKNEPARSQGYVERCIEYLLKP